MGVLLGLQEAGNEYGLEGLDHDRVLLEAHQRPRPVRQPVCRPLRRSPRRLLPQLLKPLAQFGRRELVDDSAPRLFAVVQVYGKEEDGIAAWGMALDDHAEIIDVEGRVRMNVRSPERGVRRFAHPPHISARLMWVREQPAG
ncbi:hypothetical protein ACH4S9_24050 [Streptomyces sp. NPDC021225]|uniref:hypothetical protein n=1 Tax=Streptomyces sp. NPDC021225 TaxID=3365121 RepID=UPI003792A212